MVNIQEFQNSIQHVEQIKKNLIALVGAAENKIGAFCNDHASEWMNQELDTTKQNNMLNYFALSDEKVLNASNSLQVMDFISAVFSNPMFMFICLFLIFFIIIYIVTFILYCSCGRTCISFFSCGLFFKNKKKNNKINEKKGNEEDNTSDTENNADNNDIENTLNNKTEEEDKQKNSNENENENENENGNENETQENIQSGSEEKKKRDFKMLIVLISGLILLITMFSLSLYASTSVKNSKHGAYKTACQIIQTSKNLLVGECSNTNSENQNNDTCFAVKDVLEDGIISLKGFLELLHSLDDQNMLSKDQTIPLLQEVDSNILKLNAFKENVEKNGKLLSENYMHYLLLGQHIKTLVDSVVENIQEKKPSIETVVMEAKNKINKIGEQMEKILKEDVHYLITAVNEMMKKLEIYIAKSDTSSIIKTYIDHFFNKLNTGFNILLIPMYIVFIITCVFIFYLIKKGEQNYYKLVVKLSGIFSVYFGFITILIMIFALIFTSMSMFGSTTCMMTKNVSSSKKSGLLSKFTDEVPIIGTCLKDENASLVKESYIKDMERKISQFDYENLTKNIDQFTKIQKDIAEKFENSVENHMNKLWLIHVDPSTENRLFTNIKSEQVKAALLITHIYKEDIQEEVGMKGVDNFLKIANAIFFLNNNGTELCYEEPTCENVTNKYNVTGKSTINDQKYIDVKNKATENMKNDLDNVLQLLVLKAKILNEKIFDVSDFVPNKTDKLNIKEYVAPSFKVGENKSFVHEEIYDFINRIKNPKGVNFLKQVTERSVEIKNYTMEKIYKYKKKLTCQVIFVEVQNVKNALCYGLIYNIAHITVAYFVIGIFTFLLWLYFLCLWVHHKTHKIEDVEEKVDENQSGDN